ncbi:ABC transporter ATP-binding protein [Lawsonibacter faecis]|uniref:ABC transporter ATP-binding protein n=1 Tax=Lawsonibacter faecis TaxID=2763052 RepID=A0A8J6JJA9_9FIRM|nr:ABC transporter ATP-binding protein [Lawsonibacter faecis]MBC5737123.1 ABC transporter ATP-binding protein [Lawsonibacter faecis]
MLKTLMGSIRGYQKSSLLAPFFVALEVVMETLIPLLMARLIDEGIDGADMTKIWTYGLILVAMAMLALLFGAASGHYAAVASAGYAKNLRKDMYDRIQDFSFTNIDKFSAASLVTRLTTDVSNVQNAYQMLVRVAVRAPFMLICALVFSITLSPALSTVFLFAVPILGVGLWFIMTRAHPIFERVFRTYDKLNNVVRENLRGIRVVKSFVREDFEVEKFGQVSTSIYRDFTKAEKLLAFNSPLMQFSVYGCMVLISWFGARLVVGGGLSTGDLTSFFTYTMQILMSLMMLSMVFVMIVMARASAERIVEVLREEPDLHDPADPVETVADGSIVFEDVRFRYSAQAQRDALSGVSLTIRSGETVGILGGTGSAKSSLVQLIPRLYDVTGGRVSVGGRDVREYAVAALRDQVAMVLQKNVLFSGTIKENLRWGSEHATDEELVHACKLAQADGFIRELPDGYDTYIEQGGSNVSGGQKQRLCIARALLKNPKILILDDSTSAVDTATDASIRRAFREEIPGTTKIIIAQRVSSVQDADKIIIMNNGRVDAVGTHDQLLASSAIYREVYSSQTKGGGADE